MNAKWKRFSSDHVGKNGILWRYCQTPSGWTHASIAVHFWFKLMLQLLLTFLRTHAAVAVHVCWNSCFVISIVSLLYPYHGLGCRYWSSTHGGRWLPACVGKVHSDGSWHGWNNRCLPGKRPKPVQCWEQHHGWRRSFRLRDLKKKCRIIQSIELEYDWMTSWLFSCQIHIFRRERKPESSKQGTFQNHPWNHPLKWGDVTSYDISGGRLSLHPGEKSQE